MQKYEYQGGTYDSLHEVLETCLPVYNTGVGGITMPMLATDHMKVKKIEYPVLIQPKLDGVRCLMIVKAFHTSADITFLSRSGKAYTGLQHIQDDMVNYIAGCQMNFILDGEIYANPDELSFQGITAAVKKFDPINTPKLKFRCYDIVNDRNQTERLNMIKDLISEIDSSNITSVETIVATDFQVVKYHHDEWVKAGYEGAMIRLMDGKYEQGARSRSLLKVKVFDETEFAFKNFEFGQRGVEDLIAVCWTDNGQEFRAKMTGTLKEKQELYNKDDLEGKSLTVKHFGYTDSKLPRFPIGKSFRDYE